MAKKEWSEKHPVGINVSLTDLARMVAQLNHELQFFLVRHIMTDWSDGKLDRLRQWIDETRR